ncbi:surface antigen BspA-like [Trichomonas vaginalis G3]|uniref:Surface antigen BspA-like n=1 Tax=Trichomonas vaginalis (strain ATCC PRA-98 / G3) TaxID=412133 RepID=A2EVE4_TRIV3|nr:regulation of response to stimulus [Trichomonas vaginalis G3]EAY03390.1 surface antigen BspA-like [Trichomonas vaginalis G3]KAI5538076.1 regulation of response to stimulus [Trichomonas vaginalis G3]|eukprot:XP_001315613.1 surface antigen BspA-like [Trichomonas vaginalis G3]
MNSGLTRVSFKFNTICNSTLPSFIFCGCKSLSSIEIPHNTITIETSSLSGTSITSVIIPDSVTRLGDQCFKDCISPRSITINNGRSLSRIGYGCFEGCTSFSSVSSFSSTNFVSESGAIYSSDKRRMHIYPPASKRSYFYLLEGVTSVEDSAFMGCINLRSVLLPEFSLIHIGRSSFQGCSNLRQITIPSSVTSVDTDAFKDCPLLVCGVLIQNDKNKTFVDILRNSGLSIGSTSFCSGFSCKANLYLTNKVPLSSISVFILM